MRLAGPGRRHDRRLRRGSLDQAEGRAVGDLGKRPPRTAAGAGNRGDGVELGDVVVTARSPVRPPYFAAGFFSTAHIQFFDVTKSVPLAATGEGQAGAPRMTLPRNFNSLPTARIHRPFSVGM